MLLLLLIVFFSLFSDSLHSLPFVSVLQISSPIPGNYVYPISFCFLSDLTFLFCFHFGCFRFSFHFVSIMLGCFDSMVLLLVWIAIDFNCCLYWLGFDLWLSESITSHSDIWMRWVNCYCGHKNCVRYALDYRLIGFLFTRYQKRTEKEKR